MTGTAATARPLICPTHAVRKDWIDFNDHMNMAYYMMVFDWGVDFMNLQFGIGPDYVKARQLSTMTLQASIWYRQEVVLGDPLEVRAQMIAADNKKFHVYLEMHQTRDNFLAAISEQAIVHVDLKTRRSAPFPADVLERVERMRAAHACLPVPEFSGRGVSIARR